MTDDDSSTRRSHRSHRSVTHGEAHYYFTVAACLNVSRLGLSNITQQRGASPVLALPCASGSLTEESTGWTFSRDCMHHLTVSIAGGQPAGVFLILRSSSPHRVGCLSTREPISVRIDSNLFRF